MLVGVAIKCDGLRKSNDYFHQVDRYFAINRRDECIFFWIINLGDFLVDYCMVLNSAITSFTHSRPLLLHEMLRRLLSWWIVKPFSV